MRLYQDCPILVNFSSKLLHHSLVIRCQLYSCQEVEAKVSVPDLGVVQAAAGVPGQVSAVPVLAPNTGHVQLSSSFPSIKIQKLKATF